jgi:hypothetical protein
MAQNMEALLDRMLNVPEGFQPTPSEIDLQVARLLGVTPAQADKPKPPSAEAPEHRNPAHTADRASLVDRPNWADYNDRRSQRRGLTAFEDAIPHDDW